MYVVERNGRWTGYYRHGGKRLSAGTWNTKVEAEYHAMQAGVSGVTEPSRAVFTLSEYLEGWFKSADLMPITLKGYESVLRRFVMAELGAQKVTSISARQVSDLLARLRAQGVGSATVAQVKASLGSALSRLVETGELPVNPTRGIKVKQRHADIQNVLEPEEFKEILSNLPTHGAKLLAQFLVVSGCRFGEATEMRVRDINFKSGEIYVQRRVSDLGASHTSRFMVIDATKSGHKRSLIISKALLLEIQGYVTAKALRKDDLLFSRLLVDERTKIEPSRGTKPSRPFEKDGKKFQHGTLYAYTHGRCRCEACLGSVRKHRQKAKPYQKPKPYQKQQRFIDQTSHLPRDVWRTIWNKAIDKSAIGWSPRTHDLRHANATHLLKSGVDVHEVKERLGHQSIKTTERYLHRLRHNQSKASESASDFLE
jgi:integrase